MGTSGRAMLKAIVGKEVNPEVMAQLAIGRLRNKRASVKASSRRTSVTTSSLHSGRTALVTLMALMRQLSALIKRLGATRKSGIKLDKA
jgi:hypothetical protein